MTCDEQGRYVALLGSASSGGVPVELFTSGRSRWLGVQAPGYEEQPRVLLVSVPYALKAADAETLGGRSAAAFVLLAPAAGAEIAPGPGKDGARQASLSATAAANSGTANYLGKFASNGVDLINSALLDDGAQVVIGPVGQLYVNSHLNLRDGNNAGVLYFPASGASVGGESGLSLRSGSDGNYTNRLEIDGVTGGVSIGGHVGIGTSASPNEQLYVQNTDDRPAISGRQIASTAQGGGSFGVRGETGTPGDRFHFWPAAGVYETNTSSTGDFNVGVWGENHSPGGYGIYSYGNARVNGFLFVDRIVWPDGSEQDTASIRPNQMNIFTRPQIVSGGGSPALTGSFTYDTMAGLGGYFSTASILAGSAGVYAEALAANTAAPIPGVHGSSASTGGLGVEGLATASTGLTYGGYFQSASSGGMGVYGSATATSGASYGVYGKNQSPSGFGGWFQNNNSSGKALAAADSSGIEAFTVLATGKVGVRTAAPNRELEVNGGVRLNTATAKPSCDATVRGTFWVTQGGAGVKDSVEVCAKDAADNYAWRTLF